MGGLSLHPEEPVTDSLLPGSWDFPQLHENKSKSEAGITDEWVGRGWRVIRLSSAAAPPPPH